MSEPRASARTIRRSLTLGVVNSVTLRVGNLLVGVLLAHLLAPQEFGVYAIALTVLAILANFTDLGMTAFLVRVGDVEHRAPTVLTLGLIVGSVLAAAMWFVAPSAASFMGSTQATPAIRVLALTLVLSGATAVPSAVLQRGFKQGRQLIADASSFVVSTVAVIPMVLAGYGAMSLAWSRLVGQTAALVLLYVLSGFGIRVGFDRRTATHALRFGVPLGAANLLSWLLLNADFVLVGHAMGAYPLGFYVLAFNISSWPASAMAQALRAVALPVFSRDQRKGGGPHSTKLLSAAAGLTMAAAAPAGLLMMALASPLVDAVYGHRWSTAAAPLAALAAFGVLRPLFDLLATFLTARNRTGSVLAVQILWTVSLVVALLLGIAAGGLFGAGVAHVVVAVGVVLPAYLWALRKDGLRPAQVLTACRTPVLAGLAAAGFAFVVALLLQSPWPALLLAGGGALFLYALMVFRWVRRTAAVFDAEGDLGAARSGGPTSSPPPTESRARRRTSLRNKRSTQKVTT